MIAAHRMVCRTGLIVFLTLTVVEQVRGQFPWQRPVRRDPAEIKRIVGPIVERESSRDLTIA